MLRKENKSYSFTDFGDLLHTSMYQILTRKIKKKRTIYLRKTILIGSHSREENKSFALQITNVFLSQIIVISTQKNIRKYLTKVLSH